MAYRTLSIPDPCQQNWDDMAPAGEGRHCTACNKIIVDFSELSNNELIEVLQNQQPHCGRFSDEQMDIMFYVHEKEKERKKYWNSVAAAIVAGVLQLSTGYGQTNRHVQKLYPRSLAIEKYPQQKTPETESDNKDKQWISILVKNSSNLTLSGVEITINGIKVNGTTNNEGSFVYQLPRNFDLKKKVVIKLDGNKSITTHSSFFKIKTVEMTIGELVNRTHIIILDKKKLKRRGHIMGRIAGSFKNKY